MLQYHRLYCKLPDACNLQKAPQISEYLSFLVAAEEFLDRVPQGGTFKHLDSGLMESSTSKPQHC